MGPDQCGRSNDPRPARLVLLLLGTSAARSYRAVRGLWGDDEPNLVDRPRIGDGGEAGH